MRYLRIYEDFGDDYYEEISKNEYYNAYDETTDFTDDEISIISKFCKKIEFGVIVDGYNSTQDRMALYYLTEVYISIYRLVDEWFIVRKDEKYYKADQIDGLIRLLNDII